MSKEVWKQIEESKNYYISNLGRLKSMSRMANNHTGERKTKELILSQYSSSGYYQVCLFIDGKKRMMRVHRLIAKAFIKNNDNKKCINHKDGNKLNNNIENLEWVTHSENTLHALRTNLYKSASGEKHGMSKLNWKSVDFIRKSKLTRKELALKFKVDVTNIKNIQNNLNWIK